MYLHLHPEQARSTLHKGLIIGRGLPVISPIILEAVAGFAWLYMNKTQLIRAGELAGLVKHHPGCILAIQRHLDEFLPQLEASLTPTDLQAAMERGNNLDLDRVVAELLEEFAEDKA